MTQDYYGTKRITAWPTPHAETDAPGYAVKYEDGYVSWSPKAVFEAAYQPITAMNFGHALAALKDGHRVARTGWNNKAMWLDIQVPDPHSKINLPYIFLSFVSMGGGRWLNRVPWLASQTDMLAEDWTIIEETSHE